MASFTLSRIEDVWPVGTTVGAYPVANWLQSQLPPSGAAQGSATSSVAVQSDGTLTFTGLADGASYYAGASVSGSWRYRRFSTDVSAEGGSLPAGGPGYLSRDEANGTPTWETVVPGSGTQVTLDGVPVDELDVNTDVTPSDIGAASASALTAHTGDTANPHAVTKTQVGLGSVDNTADTAKPVSTAQAAAIAAKATNPMTTAGDLIVGGASGAPARLAKGADGQVLKMASGAVTWGTDSTGGGGGGGSVAADTIFDAKGDLAVGTGADTAARLPVSGVDGRVLVEDSSQATGLNWKGRGRSIADASTPVTVVNTTVEGALVTLAVPSTVQAGDILRFRLQGDLLNNSAGTVIYTFRLKLGGTTILTTGTFTSATNVNRKQTVIEGEILIVTPASDQRIGASVIIGAASSNSFALGTPGAVGAGYATGTVDLTAGVNLTATVQMDVANALAEFRLATATLSIQKR